MSINNSVPDSRLSLLLEWLSPLESRYSLKLDTLTPASNDASFRRYFRVLTASGSFIVMDAPPPQEDVRPFVDIAKLFGTSGANLPKVHEAELTQGFLLLDDFGATTFLDVLNAETAPALYGDALDALIRIQSISQEQRLPNYDAALLKRELELYPEWYLAKHKQYPITPKDRQMIDTAFQKLVENNLSQPKVFVHRDYHSRNLMLLPGPGNPGVLDFQDAVYGPITYDLVSLLRDAYIVWTETEVIDYCVRYWEKARAAGLPVASDFSAFYRDFEWMGLQRHLKVLGIFARLYHRDGKERYLNDIPLVLNYVVKTASRYRDFGPLLSLIERVDGQAVTSGFTF